MSATGEVKATTGVVIAIDDSGTRRLLKVGDSVSTGEQVVTGELGSVAIEFDNGLSMDLGRNVSETLSLEEALATENQIDQMEDSVEKEVNAEQQTLLMGEDYDPTDPTTGMEAPGAGPDGAGPTEDDGHSVVQNEHLAPRMTPESGFETIGIGVEFPELPPELIQNPITPVVAGTVAAVVPQPDPNPDPNPQPIPPEVSIFMTDELGIQDALIEGKFDSLGFKVDPVAGDIVTNIVISGFPENDGNNTSDWNITPFIDLPNDAKYTVTMLGGGPTQTPEGQWEVALEVNGAVSGEEIIFSLNLIPNQFSPDSKVPLQVATTLTNGTGGFEASSGVEVPIILVVADMLESNEVQNPTAVPPAVSPEFVDTSALLTPVTEIGPENSINVDVM